MPDPGPPCPSDLSDAGWAALEPLLPPPSHIGRPFKWPRRLMVGAIFCPVRSGCAWRMLPRGHVPPRPAVFSQFARGRLARDYERLPEMGGAMIHTAMARTMLRRIAA